MNDMLIMLGRWQWDTKAVRERTYSAPTPREHWHAVRHPDINPDEAIWDRIREEVTANTGSGTATMVCEKMDALFAGLAERTAKVKQRCRRELQARADALVAAANQMCDWTNHVDLTLRSV
jgi:hypothetical protein